VGALLRSTLLDFGSDASTTYIMIYDTVIIGGGVVGLSILRSALLDGYNAVLLERNPNLCDGASGRNSGVICTGVDAPSGSLERALIRDSISRVREFCIDHNVPMRECGSLVCLWPWDEHNVNNTTTDEHDEKKIDDEAIMSPTNSCSDESLKHVLHESHIAGDKDAALLSSETVLQLEPSLSSNCRGAVHIPGEIVVDPWLFPLALATHARELGMKKSLHSGSGENNIDVIQTEIEVIMDASTFDAERGIWNLVTSQGDEIKTKTIINAAGVNSDLLQKSASSVVREIKPPPFAARPRRGQYIVYSAPIDANDSDSYYVPVRPIQPVPTDRTKGIFVYSTLYDQIVVGPTAKDQTSRTNDEIEKSVAIELAAHASRVFDRTMGSSSVPSDANFDPTVVGEYVGIRPGTSKRDYQIHLCCRANFITVGGIRSTGLSASLGIGRHVVQTLLSSIVSRSDDDENSVASLLKYASPTPLPDVNSLVEEYHSRGDGTIAIEGHVYKVTHPLTRMGWDARSGIASGK
jgi:glycerol-3-phosphate dehydrogenase